MTARTDAIKALTNEFKNGFGVDVESKSSKGVVTFQEVGELPTNTTQSLRINWLKRRARQLGFENVGHNQFKFLGPVDEEDSPPTE